MFRRKDKYLLQIEYDRDGIWVLAGADYYLPRKPVFSENLAASAYTVFVSDWQRIPEGRRTYRAALYKVSRRGRRKLLDACPIPPAGWGIADYHYVDWPTGLTPVWYTFGGDGKGSRSRKDRKWMRSFRRGSPESTVISFD